MEKRQRTAAVQNLAEFFHQPLRTGHSFGETAITRSTGARPNWSQSLGKLSSCDIRPAFSKLTIVLDESMVWSNSKRADPQTCSRCRRGDDKSRSVPGLPGIGARLNPLLISQDGTRLKPSYSP